MTLSQNARKGLAIGLAASTVLMSAMTGLIPAAFAAPHADGCNVLSNGTVYYVLGGQLRGFPSAEVFTSWGNGFGGVQQATAEDLALPRGPVMVYADGTLVKGPNDPLVYLVSNGQKRGFTTGAVFTGRGFKFSNIQSAPANTFADLPTGANIDNTTERHSAGVWVIDSTGTVWRMTATGRVGLPSMAVFNSWGKSFSTVVAANAADLTANNEGVAQAKPSCSSGSNPPPVSGSVNVSTASDNPASGTVITNATTNHAFEATADMLHMTFAGSGSVTQLVLQKTGVSSNTVLNNVYLYNGNTRITDSASVSSTGSITFSSPSGLFNAPASISVKADIAAAAGSGQSVGVSFVSGMSGSSSISGSAVGNQMSLAAIDTLATAVLGTNTGASGNGNTVQINAGTTNYTIWATPLTTTQRTEWLKSLTLKEVGTANSDALANYSMYLDGTQVATTGGLTSINGANYAVFVPGSPVTVTSGSHTLEVHADILKGSGRTMQFSLANAADLMLTDSSFNVNTSVFGASIGAALAAAQINGGTLSIQNGSVTGQTDPSFGSVSTIPGGGTNVAIGKFKLTAYGEDVQVNNLEVTLATTSMTNGINNLALFTNGVQVGSTKSITGATNGVATNFTLGSSLIIPAGTSTVVEVHVDLVDQSNANITAGTIQAKVIGAAGNDASNGTGRTSQSLLAVPSSEVDGPTLTVGSGSVTVASNPAYLNQTLNPNSSNQKIGSFVIAAGSNDSLRVSNLALNLVRNTDHTTALTTTDGGGSNWPAYTDISNVKVVVNGGGASSPQSSAASFNFSTNSIVAASGTMTVDVWADLGNTGGNEVFQVSLKPTINAVTTNSSLTPGSFTAGQAITLNSASLQTATASGGTATSALVSSTTGPAAMFNFTTTSGTANINELKFDVTDAVPTAGGLANVVSAISVNGSTPASVTHLTGTGPGTVGVASGGTTVTGVNTTFLSTFKVGDLITVVGDNTVSNTNIAITAIASDTSMTTAAMTNLATAKTYTYDEGYVADISNLSIAVPSSSPSGVDVSVVPTYNAVTASGNGGIATNTRAQLGLIFVKSVSGNTPSTVYYSGASGAPATLYSNPMVLVASAPAINGTSGVGTSVSGGVSEVLEFTIAAPSTGSVRVKQIGFTPNWGGALTNAASDSVSIYDPSNSSLVLNLAQGGAGVSNKIALVSGTQNAIILDTPLIVSAGQSRTLRIKVDTAGLTSAGNSFRLDLTNSGETYAAHNTAQPAKWAWNDFTISDYLNGYLLKNLNVTGPTLTHS